MDKSTWSTRFEWLVWALFFGISCSPVKWIQSDPVVHPSPEFVQKDALGNLFRNDQHMLWRIQKDGSTIDRYTHPDFHIIHSLDVSDPYKILVFYREHQKIELLDKQLNPLIGLDLRSLESQIDLVCRSMDGFLWLFDSDRQLLIKTDEELSVLSESFPLYQEGMTSFSPGGILATMDKLILSDVEKGMLLYDHLGNFRKLIPARAEKLLGVSGDEIFYLRQGVLYKWDLIDFWERALLDLHEQTGNCFYLDQGTRELEILDPDNACRTTGRIILPTE